MNTIEPFDIKEKPDQADPITEVDQAIREQPDSDECEIDDDKLFETLGNVGKKDESSDSHGGYRYWVRSIPDAHLLPSSTPQKIEAPMPSSLPLSNSMGLSAWNKLGTWEERNVSRDVEKRIAELLKDREIKVSINSGETTIQLRNMLTRSCESTICFVRGKPRFGYEVGLEGSWKVVGGLRLSGSVTAENLTDHDDVPDVSLTPDFTSSDSTSEDEDETSGVDPRAFWNTSRRVIEKTVAEILKSTVTEIGSELKSNVI